jgi:hypothetical protein
MFAGKTRSLPKRGWFDMCSTRTGSGLTHKYYTVQEKLLGANVLAYLSYSSVTKKTVFYTIGNISARGQFMDAEIKRGQSFKAFLSVIS